MVAAVLIVVAGVGLTIWSLTYGVGQFAEFLRGDVTADDIKRQVDHITRHMALAWLYVLASVALGLPLGVGGLITFLTAPSGPPPLPDQGAGGK